MTLPIETAPFEAVSDTDKTIAGVLLAAGSSTRFGESDKLLANLDGAPIAKHAVKTLESAAVDPVVVVVSTTDVRDALSTSSRAVVWNPNAEQGQATSVRVGIRAIMDRADAALIALGDMPGLRVRTVDRLVRAYRADAGSALAAAYKGDRGNPVIFDSRHFDTLLDVEGDQGGRNVLLNATDAALVETGDPTVLSDIDTREDLSRVRNRS